VPAHQRVPRQEPGVRPSRALGYRLNVDLEVSAHGLDVTIVNGGRLGAQVQARSTTVAGAPFSYTVGAGRTLRPSLTADGHYDVSFHGPNGFYRRFSGSTHERFLEVRARRDAGYLVLTLHNRSGHALRVHLADAHAGERTVRVAAHDRRRVRVPLTTRHGWYDVLVTVPEHPHWRRALAGRVENGRPRTSDPLLGR
jgi:phospholipase C